MGEWVDGVWVPDEQDLDIQNTARAGGGGYGSNGVVPPTITIGPAGSSTADMTRQLLDAGDNGPMDDASIRAAYARTVGGSTAPASSGVGLIGGDYDFVGQLQIAKSQQDLARAQLEFQRAHMNAVGIPSMENLRRYQEAQIALSQAQLQFQRDQFNATQGAASQQFDVNAQLAIWNQQANIANQNAQNTGLYRPPAAQPALPYHYLTDQFARNFRVVTGRNPTPQDVANAGLGFASPGTTTPDYTPPRATEPAPPATPTPSTPAPVDPYADWRPPPDFHGDEIVRPDGSRWEPESAWGWPPDWRERVARIRRGESPSPPAAAPAAASSSPTPAAQPQIAASQNGGQNVPALYGANPGGPARPIDPAQRAAEYNQPAPTAPAVDFRQALLGRTGGSSQLQQTADVVNQANAGRTSTPSSTPYGLPASPSRTPYAGGSQGNPPYVTGRSPYPGGYQGRPPYGGPDRGAYSQNEPYRLPSGPDRTPYHGPGGQGGGSYPPGQGGGMPNTRPGWPWENPPGGYTGSQEPYYYNPQDYMRTDPFTGQPSMITPGQASAYYSSTGYLPGGQIGLAGRNQNLIEGRSYYDQTGNTPGGELGILGQQQNLSERLGLGNLSIAQAQQRLDEEVQRGNLSIAQAQQLLRERESGQRYGLDRGQLTGYYGGQATLGGRAQDLAEQEARWRQQYEQAQLRANPANYALTQALGQRAPWQQGLLGGQEAQGGGPGGAGQGQSLNGVPTPQQYNPQQLDRMNPDQRAVFESAVRASGRTPQDYYAQQARYRPSGQGTAAGYWG